MAAMAVRVMSDQSRAWPCTTSDQTGLPRRDPGGTGQGLLVQALVWQNMQRAWEPMKATNGAARCLAFNSERRYLLRAHNPADAADVRDPLDHQLLVRQRHPGLRTPASRAMIAIVILPPHTLSALR